jgi:hypothetical protein
MTRADWNITGFGMACVRWWKSFAAEAHARAVESLEQRPVVLCPGPPLGITRLMLLATLFEPQR